MTLLLLLTASAWIWLGDRAHDIARAAVDCAARLRR